VKVRGLSQQLLWPVAVGDPEFVDKYLLNAATPLRLEVFANTGSGQCSQCIGTAELTIQCLEVYAPFRFLCYDSPGCICMFSLKVSQLSIPIRSPSSKCIGALWVMIKRLHYPSPHKGLQTLIAPLVASKVTKVTSPMPTRRTEEFVIEPRKTTVVDEKARSVLTQMLARGTATWPRLSCSMLPDQMFRTVCDR
jgi:hypothetical protein